jgi:hypothetical protein
MPREWTIHVIDQARRQPPTTLADFWDMAHAATSATVHLADTRLQSLATASLAELRAVLVQYRWFTGYYPGDLAILVAKLPPSRLRSFVGGLVNEELGCGQPAAAHLALYDAFLDGLGDLDEMVDELTDPNCVAIMDSMRHSLQSSAYPYAIGLRGMGGECLCQVYLQALHTFLLRNPLIDELRRAGELDWRFWDLHAGAEDEAHARVTRECIQDLVASPADVAELAAGYLEAEAKWMLFWHNAFEGLARRRVAHAVPPVGRVAREVRRVAGAEDRR